MGERKALTEGNWEGHLFRYYLASGFVRTGDTVIDAACGVGYGSEIFRDRNISYIGVDRSTSYVEFGEEDWRRFVAADLTSWSPDFEFDVFVSFETVEHLADYSNLIDMARRARKWILMSVPVVPTVHVNEFHLHDFEPGELPNYVCNKDWKLWHSVPQPAELAEIYVFRRG